MESRIAEDKLSQRISLIRRSRQTRNQKTVASNILETIVQINGGEAAADQDGRGSTLMKFVVKKEDLKQVLDAIKDGRSSTHRSALTLPPSASLEQRLNLMRRRQIWRGASQGKTRSRGSWRPALQSIPEE